MSDDNIPGLHFFNETTGTDVALPTGPTGLRALQQTRTYKARDGNVSEKIRLDIDTMSMNAIRELLVQIAVDETDEQISIDNPPAFAEVDGTRGKGIADAQRRITISFGNRLKIQALRQLEDTLRAAIEASTERKTGKLLTGWKWTYVRNGRSEALPLGGASGIPMGPRDMILLTPVDVIDGKGHAYATAVNKRVAGSGKLSFRRSAKGKVTRANQSIGFLALTARAAKTSSAFAGFSVTANFSSKYALPGEVVGAKLGGLRTGYLKITPKRGRRG